MSQKVFGIPITDVVDLLGLERDPRSRAGASSFNVKCPFCASARTRKYHMNINTVKNVYFCPKCMDSSTGNSGALDLYGRVRLGTPLLPGRNGAELFHKLACELEGNHVEVQRSIDRPPPPDEILPAENKVLNAAYRTLLQLPYLALNRGHGNNLLKRGLDRDTIETGMYASFPKAAHVLMKHEAYDAVKAWYIKKGGPAARSANPILKYYSDDEIMVGLLIAKDVLKQGVALNNVPGFYKFKGAWCFRYDQGMAIPTVALDGNIVGMQVRRDVATERGLRYMTVSSKDLPCGVTTKIARTHVARDGEINKDTTVYVTEGPLKANVILHLLRENGAKNVAVIAIQGVNNTKELPEIAAYLNTVGIKYVYSAFDMDKTGNMSVAKAAGLVKKIFNDASNGNIAMKTLCWDEEYASEKYDELRALCEQHDLQMPEKSSNIFDDVYCLASLLNKNKIEYNIKKVNGKSFKDHWRDETKGLDDYLNFTRNKTENNGSF